MKKKIIVRAMVITLLLTMLTGCGNMDMLDTNYTYCCAIIKMPDGEILEVEIDQWCDYEGEQVQIIAKDGTVYLVSTYNCILINHK
jgi:hypothetical protein